ncbi:MAG: alpha/beta hydrolase [Polyangiaceae bacterium]|nr:alpha/beta hydrolase [Polyangiaceae bacterium]
MTLRAGIEYDAHEFVESSDGTRLFCGVRGEGEPTLVLNDGVGCDGFAWRYVHPYFGERHCVLHWHYRGHGRSGAPPDLESMTIEQLADDLLRVLDATGVERGVLVGHSMGTQVSLELYRRAPERVAGLVLVCGSYGHITRTFHGTDLLQQILPDIVRLVRGNVGAARALWGRIPAAMAFRVASLAGEVDASTIHFEDFEPYWQHVSAIGPDTFLTMLENAGEHSAKDLLPTIKVPTLIIAAERDTFTPPELARSMAEEIPAAELFVLRGGSHAAVIEQPEAILLRLEKFLRERLEG